MYSVDILIPTYRPGPEFAELLRRLARQHYAIHQVLIINTERQYWDPSFEKAYPGCRAVSYTHLEPAENSDGSTGRMSIPPGRVSG